MPRLICRAGSPIFAAGGGARGKPVRRSLAVQPAKKTALPVMRANLNGAGTRSATLSAVVVDSRGLLLGWLRAQGSKLLALV